MPLRKASNALVSNSFFIFIIRFFPSLANLLVMIWYSRNLPGAEYGHYVNFWSQLLVIYPVMCFGIHVLLITYSRDFIAGLLQRISTRQYALYLVWVIFFGVVFTLLQRSSFGGAAYIPFLFILFYALTFILESLLIVFRSYAVLTLTSVLYAIAFCCMHWYVLAAGFSLPVLFACLLIITVLRFLIYGGMVIRSMKQYTPEEQPGQFSSDKIRSLWLHLGLYDVLQVLFSYIDKFIISLVLTAPLSAIYYNGSQNIPFIPLLLSAAGSAVLMQLASVKKHDETADVIGLMNRSGRVLSCIVFPVFFFLFFFRYELIVGLFTNKYEAAVPVFAMAVLVLPVKAYSFTTVLQRLHKGAVINAGAVADLLLACALMYPLYLWLRLPGIALSFVISTWLQAAFYLIYSAGLLQVSPLKLIPYANWLIKLIIFASVFIAIRYICDQYFVGVIALILGAAVMVIIIAMSLLMELKKQKKDVVT